MTRSSKHVVLKAESKLLEVKSKLDAEFRRFSVDREGVPKFEDFRKVVETLHSLGDLPFTLSYSDPKDGDLLPINNDDNYARAIQNAKPILRLIVQRKGDSLEELNGYSGALNRSGTKSLLSQFLSGTPSSSSKKPHISYPEDFRQVSQIIDVDIVPDTCRRVRLLKHGSDKPLGFYIRDGSSVRITSQGYQKVPGIFISRLVPGGLAESTGLLAVNDEVLEVNGIEVAGKSLDQVTDMMVANSSNLIITVRPANQSSLPRSAHNRGSFSRASQLSSGSMASAQSVTPSDEDHFDQDEIRDLTGVVLEESTGFHETVNPSEHVD
ncbi:unnamed protein product [Notodromas monacha]|uniref:Uncharacterized protein n=1 Tax=Notodromas monacha TaxID=399045 RepID=A0A7R9BEE3_9CRUS|nr:unnamed protein product [Notodromas monacha]CAG0913856.1 unnamed protein product [Notodromas monacha]